MGDRIPIWEFDLVEPLIINPPDVLGTICEGEAHGLEEGLMMLRLTMLENSFLATLSLSGGNRLALANTGGPWVVIECSTPCLQECWWN